MIRYKDIGGMIVPVVPRARSKAMLRMELPDQGEPCPYCRRPMRFNLFGAEPTRDHVIPKSKGGDEMIWACWTCNNMKGDMLPGEWAAFMAANPEWWTQRKKPIDGEPK